MASDRTFVTELATALGMVGDEDLEGVIRRRPKVLANLTDADWDHLEVLHACGDFDAEFIAGFDNGRSFFLADHALRCRRPRIIEWTGARRSVGDEATPADLRIDHVYLVSCKYQSKILHNPSPARLFERLLSTEPADDSRDWYERVAPNEYEALYAQCAQASGLVLPMFASGLDAAQRKALSSTLADGWPAYAADAYEQLCSTVSEQSAERWRARVDEQQSERMLWRLLRIGSAPYFILGANPRESIRLRIDSPWDWRQAYRLVRFDITEQKGGQPRVGWEATCEHTASGQEIVVAGHVEIRWSHGRFAQRPEAKVYLDTPTNAVPGYHAL